MIRVSISSESSLFPTQPLGGYLFKVTTIMTPPNKIDETTLIGLRIGLMTIEKAWRNAQKNIIVNCKCDCGHRWQGHY